VEPVVLVHLSDIHFTGKSDGTAYRHESTRHDLVLDLKKMRGIVGDAKTVVVTGDIANTGAKDEYAVAGRWLDEVSDIVGNDRALVFTVPGNHDVDCSEVGTSAELAHDLLRECRGDDLDERLAALLADPARPLLRKLDNYNEFAAQYGCEVNEKGEPWEVPIPLGGGYLLMVRGLCSVFNSDRGDKNSLMIGKRQTTLFAEEGKVYLLLAHHGPGDLRDAEAVRDKIRDRAVALLSGHRHAQRAGDMAGCVEVSAGAVNPKEETGWPPEYNWLRITLIEDEPTPRLKIELWHRQWKPTANVFGAGSPEGEVQTWERQLPAHVVLTASEAPTPAKAGASAAGPAVPVSGTEPGGTEGEAVTSPDGTADARPAIVDEHGEVTLERRVRRDLFRLASKTAQVRVLADLDLIRDDGWNKPFVTMIADAISRAADQGLLETLHDLVQTAAEDSK
jgi:calcineurin-like phosphoesterase family protein